MTVVLGSVALASGCGDTESGTQVQVDKEKEAALLKDMGNYMQKKAYMKNKSKANRPGAAKSGLY